jgi:7-carboxy-7-deazaguanine synthase (Cx14CxxC type)
MNKPFCREFILPFDMAYSIKEIYYTLQGEGAQTGRPAVFCRFAGCNLWTGREADRADAVCRFCDTDFVGTDGPGGGRFATAADVAAACRTVWPVQRSEDRPLNSQPSTLNSFTTHQLVVCTGGEPLLQMDEALIDAFHAAGFEVAIETNGTIPAPAGIDWICVSPKAGADLVQTSGDELKLVYPQPGAEPERFARLDFTHFFLQPMDSQRREANTRAAAEYCLQHPQWRLSLQTHKLIGLP